MGRDRGRRRRSARTVSLHPVRPTPERVARAGADLEMADVEEGGRLARIPRVSDTSPIDSLHRRGVLSTRQRDAGARFWRDWFHAGLLQGTTTSYTDCPWPRSERTGMAVTERQVHARQSLRAARRVLGAHLGRVVEAMLVDELEAVDAGRKLFGRRDAPQARASATDSFRIALDTLADHYGL